MYITTYHWWQVKYWKSCYNDTMLVTKYKYLPFDARTTAHLDRLCLENSLRESMTNYGWLFSVCCKIFILRLSYVTKDCLKKTEIAMIAMFLFFVDILGKFQIQKISFSPCNMMIA